MSTIGARVQGRFGGCSTCNDFEMWNVRFRNSLKRAEILSKNVTSIKLAYIDPFTRKSDQCQISPAASAGILHHAVWRTWLFRAYPPDERLLYQFSLPHLYILALKGWENVLFELRSERVNSRMSKFSS